MSNIPVVDYATDVIRTRKRRLAEALPDWEIEGDPHHESTIHYESDDGVVTCGSWVSTPGKWRVFPNKDEFCHILSGHCRLIDDNGVAKDFKAGDSFMIPNGFSGYWEVVETTTKRYVVRRHPEN